MNPAPSQPEATPSPVMAVPLPDVPPPPRPGRRRSLLPSAGAILVTLTVLGVWHSRGDHPTPAPGAGSAAPLPVRTAAVTREDLFQEVSFPGEFRPYRQAELHAKISGYLESISFDLGDSVKAGELIAKLESPELRDDLDRAVATTRRAEADYQQAHLVYSRLRAVEQEHPNLVARQDLDAAEGRDLGTSAAIAAARAEERKYRNLLNYTRITAPFDGVITRRYADPGSLIQAGTTSSTQSLPLVRLSDNSRLRLDFPVSVTYVKDIRPGEPVEIRVESLGDQVLTGTISRCAGSVDDSTRTMITEVEVPNPSRALVPGMYATVLLRLGHRPHALCIPAEAVPADHKSSICVVNARDEIEERTVTFGLETPTRCEVTSGLAEGERVVLGSRSQLTPGRRVDPRPDRKLAFR